MPIAVDGLSVRISRIFNLVLYCHCENKSAIEILKSVRNLGTLASTKSLRVNISNCLAIEGWFIFISKFVRLCVF